MVNNLPNRKSIRLKGYDYAQKGMYFITLCTQNRNCLFGFIDNQQMILNDAGKMIDKWVNALAKKFNDIECDAMVIMPNHFHCIIKHLDTCVGADPCVCPHSKERKLQMIARKHSSLPCVVQWFKTMTTNEYIRGVKSKNWQPFDKKLWQRNYWEHIVRNQNEYVHILQYINENPMHWDKDKLNR